MIRGTRHERAEVYRDALERAAKGSARLKQVSDECDTEVATNFDLPAISIITRHAARLGMTREQFEDQRAWLKYVLEHNADVKGGD